MAVCRLSNVRKDYRSGMLLRRTRVLEDISFEVHRGETFAYLGHNGSGKTTSVKAILGFLRLDGGSIEVHGHAPGSVEARDRTGYLPENPYFYDHLTGREFLRLVSDLHGLNHRDGQKRIAAVLDLVNMGANANTRLRAYSKGMLQRIGLAQALVSDPELLILDEPMSGLDPAGRHQVRTILEELHSRGKTLFLSSHILADVEAIADRAAILKAGHLKRIVDLKSLHRGGRTMDVQLRGMGPAEVEELALGGFEVVESGTSQRITVEDPARLPWIIDRVHASGARLLQVTPQRQSLEEIFLQEVGEEQVGSFDALSGSNEEPELVEMS